MWLIEWIPQFRGSLWLGGSHIEPVLRRETPYLSLDFWLVSETVKGSILGASQKTYGKRDCGAAKQGGRGQKKPRQTTGPDGA